MKKTSNAERPTPNAELKASAFEIGHWALATAEPVHGEGGLGVRRFLIC